MKKSTILILSVIFIIMILFIPNNTKAVNSYHLIVDYDDSVFQTYYSLNIEPRLDNIISACRTRLSTDEVMIGYTKAPNNRDIFECFDVSFDSDIVAYVQRTGTSYADLKLEFPSTKYASIYVDTLGNYSSVMNYFTTNSFYAPTYYSDSQEFITDFSPDSSIRNILFYSDKDNIIFTNNNNENNGLFINGTYVQYGETISLYSNSEQSFLPSNYDYINHTENLEVNIPYIDVELSFPVLSDYVPYSFKYSAYFVLDSNPNVQYNLDSSLYIVNDNYVGYTNDLLVLKKYTLYKNATYFFEIYEGNSLESSNLLQTETFYTGDIGTDFVGPGYIDNPNKDNTSNILGGSIFSNFQTSDYGFTSIITAPLRLINSFDTNVCTAPVIPILGTNFTLPCGQLFWGREDISEFKEIYQIIIYGLLCYYVGIDIIRTIQDLKNPDDSKLNVIDL